MVGEKLTKQMAAMAKENALSKVYIYSRIRYIYFCHYGSCCYKFSCSTGAVKMH